MEEKIKTKEVKKFLLKKFPTNTYIDCPVPKHHWETMQEYADYLQFSKDKQIDKLIGKYEKRNHRIINEYNKNKNDFDYEFNLIKKDIYNRFITDLKTLKTGK